MDPVARRLGRGHLIGYDILELFAFVRPAQFTLPTLHGVVRTLGLSLHARTNIEVIKAFLDVDFEVDRTSPPGCMVRVRR